MFYLYIYDSVGLDWTYSMDLRMQLTVTLSIASKEDTSKCTVGESIRCNRGVFKCLVCYILSHTYSQMVVIGFKSIVAFNYF